MRALSEVELLAAWEAARGSHPAACGAALLGSVRRGEALHELLRIPLGRRDAELANLRESWFGPTLACVTSCPSCGLRVEVDVPTTALRHDVPDDVAVDVGGVEVRLPDTEDLVAAAAAIDEEHARDIILRRCVRSDIDALAPATKESIVRAMAERDPAGDTAIAIVCPECAHEWESAIDIAAHLWSEVEAAAMRTLRDVHVLATAYGWSEREILAISSQRRRVYLEMVQG